MNTSTIFFRITSSVMGGFLGSISMFLIYAFNFYFLGNSENPITKLVLIFMVFTGSLIANLTSGAFLSMSYPEKYSRKSTMLWQAFLINMFLFLITFPFFTMLNEIQIVSIFQLLFSVLATSIIYEIYSGSGTYTLTGLYGSLFGIFLIFIVINLIQTTALSSILLFLSLPLIWLVVTIAIILIEYLYSLFYKASGFAVFDPKTRL